MRRATILVLTAALTTGTLAAAAGASASPPARAGKPTVEITLAAAPSTVELGGKVTLKGRVTPRKRARGERVVVKQRTGTKPWKVVGRAKVRATGRFTWSEKPTTATTRRYKVLLPASARHQRARTAPVEVVVSKWFRVSELKPTSYQQVTAREAVVNGVGHWPSLGSFFHPVDLTAGFVEYNLYGRCTQLRTAAALTDEAEEQSTARARILLNGSPVSDLALTQLNTSQPIRANLSGVNRIRFDLASTNPDHLAQAAFLNPEFHCTDL